MKWLSELWTTSSNAVKIALIVGFVVVVALLLWFAGSLDVLGAWLGAN